MTINLQFLKNNLLVKVNNHLQIPDLILPPPPPPPPENPGSNPNPPPPTNTGSNTTTIPNEICFRNDADGDNKLKNVINCIKPDNTDRTGDNCWTRVSMILLNH